MTTLVSWVAYTETGERPDLPTAIYLATDSRITWGSAKLRWDAGRKIYATGSEPHIFGYCGDVVFPALFLSQLSSAIDDKIIFGDDVPFDERHGIFTDLAKQSFNNRFNAPSENFTILHAFRSTPWPNTTFEIYRVDYDSKANRWSSSKVSIPKKTAALILLGSGGDSAEQRIREWNTTDISGTSRAIYSAVCESISSGGDELSGGVPQVAALFTQLPPKQLGYFGDGRFYYAGFEIPCGQSLTGIEWYDSLFQRIDPASSSPLAGARRFANPKRVRTIASRMSGDR